MILCLKRMRKRFWVAFEKESEHNRMEFRHLKKNIFELQLDVQSLKGEITKKQNRIERLEAKLLSLDLKIVATKDICSEKIEAQDRILNNFLQERSREVCSDKKEDNNKEFSIMEWLYGDRVVRKDGIAIICGTSGIDVLKERCDCSTHRAIRGEDKKEEEEKNPAHEEDSKIGRGAGWFGWSNVEPGDEQILEHAKVLAEELVNVVKSLRGNYDDKGQAFLSSIQYYCKCSLDHIVRDLSIAKKHKW